MEDERTRVIVSEIAHLKMELALERQKVESLQKKVDNLSSGIGRGLWILGGGFISAFVLWITNGGMGVVK